MASELKLMERLISHENKAASAACFPSDFVAILQFNFRGKY